MIAQQVALGYVIEICMMSTTSGVMLRFLSLIVSLRAIVFLMLLLLLLFWPGGDMEKMGFN